MKRKKIMCTAVAACMALGCVVGAAGAVDASAPPAEALGAAEPAALSVESMSPEEAAIYQKTGMHLVSLTDEPVNYSGPYATELDPADEIQARTGMRLVSRTDEPIQYTPVTLAEGATVYAVTRPTKEAESYPYEQSWSGTTNYTFTNRYFDLIEGGNFDASAKGKFYADFYDKNGEYLGGVAASKVGSRYELRTYFNAYDPFDYYYAILTNQAGGSSQSAYYKASHISG